MITAVLFDIDDTLVDFKGAMTRGLVRHLARIAPQWTDAGITAASATWHAVEKVHFGRYLRGETTFEGQRRARAADFCRAHGLELGEGVEEQDAWVGEYLSHCEQEFLLFDDVVAALDLLRERGLRIGALSNSKHEYQDYKLRLLGIRDRFEVLVCCDDVDGVAKPDPRIFAAGCAALGVDAPAVVYVGDNKEADARAASRAGLQGVWLDRGRTGPSEEDFPVIGDLAGLAPLLGLLADSRQKGRS
ncbi:HAD family hydrolase [Lentzea albidocapillata]|uniref:Putative hydrolase of the HAD superfamily n=1 Tax=Lentzea albidocapillata TaxID=40571 RepID=A0A1W2CUR3_9PSEU|nr:HAD family hydrolase [Lentzea albidocapillata]SMC88973.1 putative hydrolase of the HAD superfamily [Lentzea albidocapillata]